MASVILRVGPIEEDVPAFLSHVDRQEETENGNDPID